MTPWDIKFQAPILIDLACKLEPISPTFQMHAQTTNNNLLLATMAKVHWSLSLLSKILDKFKFHTIWSIANKKWFKWYLGDLPSNIICIAFLQQTICILYFGRNMQYITGRAMSFCSAHKITANNICLFFSRRCSSSEPHNSRQANNFLGLCLINNS